MVAPFISKYFFYSLPKMLHIYPLFLPFSDSSNICSSWAWPVFLWSVFSALVGPVRCLNSAVSDVLVFDLAAGDRGLAESGTLSALATLAVPPSQGKLALWASHTVAIHSPAHTVWIVWRPVEMSGMLSPSSSLGKKGISFSIRLFLSLHAFEWFQQSDERDH